MPIWIRRRRKTTHLQGQPATRAISTIEVEGRRYFSESEAAYMLPKDMADVPRLDFQHFLLRQEMKGIYIAPIPARISSILDVGCGTGRWGREIARAFPDAQIVGMDLEEINSPGAERPANYLFKQADALKPFPFAEKSFDFVHMRLMLMSIPAFKWKDVLREIVRITRPGGWIELVEVGCTIIPQGPTTHRWYEWIRESSKVYDQDPDLPIYLSRLAAEADIKNIREFHYDVPIGEWAGHIGIASLANMKSFYDALRPRYTNQLNIDPAIIDATWTQLVEEWQRMQASIRYYVVCGQK